MAHNNPATLKAYWQSYYASHRDTLNRARAERRRKAKSSPQPIASTTLDAGKIPHAKAKPVPAMPSSSQATPHDAAKAKLLAALSQW